MQSPEDEFYVSVLFEIKDRIGRSEDDRFNFENYLKKNVPILLQMIEDYSRSYSEWKSAENRLKYKPSDYVKKEVIAKQKLCRSAKTDLHCYLDRNYSWGQSS